jgi:anti-sigma factor RsiW
MKTSSSGQCGNSPITVHAFADGELDGIDWLVFNDHLRACPDCSAEYKRVLFLKALFKLEPLRYRAPDPLRLRVSLSLRAAHEAAPVRESGGKPGNKEILFRKNLIRKEWKQTKWIAPLLAASVMIAATLTLSSNGSALEDEIIAKYRHSLIVSLPADIPSTASPERKPQFAGNLDFVPPVLDLTGSGFAYRGYRFDEVSRLNAAVLIYTQRSDVIDLFIWPSGVEPIGAVSRDGYNIIHWTRAGLKFCAISTMSAEDLSRFQEAFAARLPA